MGGPKIADCSGFSAHWNKEAVMGYFMLQQHLYEEGYPSVWGYWNRMAEYLLKGPRRIRHDC